jgi:hypothetical protein
MMSSGSLIDLDPPQARALRWPFYVAWAIGGVVVGAVLVSRLPVSLVPVPAPLAAPAAPIERIPTPLLAPPRVVDIPQLIPFRVVPVPAAPARR